ncbi:MAG: hypothetical protein EPN17_02870 [Methylobacter sp.]|nr:MAG: hypothetical protein EPN17_02870 [Methylobacter sp.]
MAIKPGTAKNDRILGTDQGDTIDGMEGDDTLLGAGGNDSILGGLGVDSLDGGPGSDTLLGGSGNDILIGGSGNDSLTGEDGNDTLQGAAGKDTLDGGLGNDNMGGGGGNDLYIVNSIGDKVVETDKLNSVDSVQSSVTFTLPDLVEHLQLLGGGDINGTGNKLNNKIFGNGGDNILSGSDGQDTLVGGVGADTLIGGSGIDSLVGGADDDIYVIGSTNDKVVETAGGGDVDEIQSTVDFSLPNNVEVLTLTGLADVRGAGNGQDNIIDGNGGANNLSGDAGDDTLFGNEGNDMLSGDAGDDQLDGGAGDDTVTYSGAIVGYQITFDSEGNSWIVEDIDDSDGNDGIDTLVDIEHAEFADQVKDLGQSTPTQPTLSIDNVTKAEGNGVGDTSFDFTVSLSAPSSTPVTVNYAVLAGTATAGTDFTATSGVLTFAANETTQKVSVAVNADSAVEADETFTVQLSKPAGATLDKDVGTATIRNDDQTQVLPVVSIADIQLPEGNDGSTSAVLTVTLSAKSTETVTVDWSTADDSANAGSDYTAKTGTVSIAPGVTSGVIKIPVSGDTDVEADETFTVNLSTPQNATVSDAGSKATVTISNDDEDQGSFVSNGGLELDMSEDADSLQGTDLNDKIGCLGGNDTVDGGSGNDSLTGGIGDDQLSGGLDDDTVVGSDGNDSLYGNAGVNLIQGGKGDDYIRSDGQDIIDAGLGNDVIATYGGGASVIGGEGNDNIYGDSSGGETLLGGNGDDTIGHVGLVYNGSWSGGNGSDLIDGGAGNDFMHGDWGDDTILGGDGLDSLYGGWGSDQLDGGNGDDAFYGYYGNETLKGGDGQDILYGEYDNDRLDGGNGVDILYGGDGDDTFVFNKGDSGVGADNRDIIKDFNGVSTVEVIDFDGLSNAALSFKGSAAFSGANQVRYAFDFTNKETIIQVNLDADVTTTELEVELIGLIGLASSDFVLTTPTP